VRGRYAVGVLVSAAEWKFQHRHNDRLLRRLELPRRDAGSALVVVFCAAGMAAALFLGWVLS
jgi:hypothetical protein